MTAPQPRKDAAQERPHLTVVPELPDEPEVPPAPVDPAPPAARPLSAELRGIPPDMFWIALWGPAGVLGLVGLLASVLVPLIGVPGVVVLGAALVWSCIGAFVWSTSPKRRAGTPVHRHGEDECR